MFRFRLLRQKCKYDSEFLLMVNGIKVTAKDSLGLLILLPVSETLIAMSILYGSLQQKKCRQAGNRRSKRTRSTSWFFCEREGFRLLGGFQNVPSLRWCYMYFKIMVIG